LLNEMAKKLTAIRISDEDMKFLQTWCDRENSKTEGLRPPLTVSFLVQRAVRELVEREKANKRKS
jgi:hypothetical protein